VDTIKLTSREREKVKHAAARARGGAAKKLGARPVQDERPLVFCDPGTYIGPERIDVFVEYVFNDGPRLTTRIGA
jgi:hypothetical protein